MAKPENNVVAATGSLTGRSTFSVGRPIVRLDDRSLLLVDGFDEHSGPDGERMDDEELAILVSQGGAFRFDTPQRLPVHPAVWIVRRGFSRLELARSLHRWRVLQREESAVFLVDAVAARAFRERALESSVRWSETWLEMREFAKAEQEAQQAEALGLEPSLHLTALRARILIEGRDYAGLNELLARAELELGDQFPDLERLLTRPPAVGAPERAGPPRPRLVLERTR
jgi:hypothetical protein